MSEFVVRLETVRQPLEAWERLWDLDRHTVVIPLTTVALDPPATTLGAGAGFTGRTAVGRVGFDDTMRVVQWRPPTAAEGGVAVVEKTSRLLGGRIEVSVAPRRPVGAAPAGPGDAGSQVTWRQSVKLPWLPSSLSVLERIAALGAGPGYRHVLRRLLD